MCVCVCVASHQPVECVRIMMWWSSNHGQGPLRSLGSVANYYVLFYLTHPSHSPPLLIFFQGGQLPPSPTLPTPTCLLTLSSDHLGVTYLRPSIPMPPSTTLLITVRAPPLQPSLAPVTPARFLLFPHPCRCRNCFHCDPRLVLRCLLDPS